MSNVTGESNVSLTESRPHACLETFVAEAGIPPGTSCACAADRSEKARCHTSNMHVSGEWPVRRARGRVVLASVDCSRVCVGASRCIPRCISPQTVGESGLGPEDKSSEKSNSPNVWFPVSAHTKVPGTACTTVLGVGQNGDGTVITCCRRVSIVSSNGKPTTRNTRLKEPLPSAFSLVRTVGLQSFDELPARRDCRTVSWPPRKRMARSFSINYLKPNKWRCGDEA